MKKIQLSKTFSLESTVATRRVAILGMSGSGKSNTACLIVENYLTMGVQTVILDNDGSWYGLRLLADGKTKGFEIPVFGGIHADYPLDFRSGALMARVIVENSLSCVLDVSDMRKGQRRQFAMELAEELFHLKKAKRTPMSFVIEEAQDFIPQRAGKDEMRMLGAFEDLSKGGRKYGIGVIIISQRPQAVNKDALNQCEILIAHYVYASQERKALADWIVEKGQSIDLVNDLTTLKEGQAFIWSPRWLGTMQKIQIDKKRTLDAARTPEFGEAARATPIARIELDKITAMMESSIRAAEENDPKLLKQRIAQLERELKTKPAPMAEIRIQEIPVFSQEEKEQLAQLNRSLQQIAGAFQASRETLDGISSNLSNVIRSHEQIQRKIESARSAPVQTVKPLNVPIRSAPAQSRTDSGNNGDLKGGELMILKACAQYPDGVTREQLTALTGYKRSSRDAFISRLKSRGAIEIQFTGKFFITETGMELLGADFEPLPTGESLRNYWSNRLQGGERSIFVELINAYPETVTRENLTGYKRSSRDAFISRLVTKRLAEITGPGTIRASQTLFED